MKRGGGGGGGFNLKIVQIPSNLFPLCVPGLSVQVVRLMVTEWYTRPALLNLINRPCVAGAVHSSLLSSLGRGLGLEAWIFYK